VVSLIILLGSWPLLFARAWNCNHRDAGSLPCRTGSGPVVALGILALAAALFALTKWALDRGDR
jgi:hypothetical protein